MYQADTEHPVVWESTRHLVRLKGASVAPLVPSRSELRSCTCLTADGLTWSESLWSSMFARTRGCFLISNNEFKADGKTVLHALIQLSKPFDFRIPQLLFDFSQLSNSLGRLIGSGQGDISAEPGTAPLPRCISHIYGNCSFSLCL